MEITTGIIITAISGVGIVASFLALAFSGTVFKRQRERLLKQLERE